MKILKVLNLLNPDTVWFMRSFEVVQSSFISFILNYTFDLFTFSSKKYLFVILSLIYKLKSSESRLIWIW